MVRVRYQNHLLIIQVTIVMIDHQQAAQQLGTFAFHLHDQQLYSLKKFRSGDRLHCKKKLRNFCGVLNLLNVRISRPRTCEKVLTNVVVLNLSNGLSLACFNTDALTCSVHPTADFWQCLGRSMHSDDGSQTGVEWPQLWPARFHTHLRGLTLHH